MPNREFPDLPFRRPKSFSTGRASGQPSVIFIHTTEGSEEPRSAEDGAAYDARRTDGTSTHFFVDSNSIVQCVYTWDRAHAARTHGNRVGIQIEVCGKAGQSSAQWNDAASAATIVQLARLCVRLREKYPRRFSLLNLTPTQLRNGVSGFAEHYDATRAWPEDNGDHTDPGKNFPWAKLFNTITAMEAAEKEVPGMASDIAEFVASVARAVDPEIEDDATDRANRKNIVKVVKYLTAEVMVAIGENTDETPPVG